MASRIARLAFTGLVAGLGFLGGAALGPQSRDPVSPAYYRMPHHVPKAAGGLSLRFAMVHDVIHERFPKTGPRHYEERVRLTRVRMDALAPDDPLRDPLADDLGVGLDKLGRPGEAVPVLREKFARQEARGLSGRDLYTTYANLGTFILHANVKGTIAGDAAARERFAEGLRLVDRSVVVNPGAHFGREAWQVTLARFVLAAAARPAVLREYDFVGDKLDEDVDPRRGRAVQHGYGFWARHHADDLRDPDALTDADRREFFRNQLTRVGSTGSTDGWRREWVAFDEPTLGIVGLWREGGGANPHFALALGEIMLRVGQRYVAWAAFERADRLADTFWPDPAAQQFLRDHCRARQARLEATLPPAEVAQIRPRFYAELTVGEAYQRAYQEYEAGKLAAGASVFDEHLFDEFHKGREPIASPTGSEEWYAVDAAAMTAMTRRVWTAVGWGLLGAGLAGLLAAWLVRARAG